MKTVADPEPTTSTADAALVISSDGHAMAQMRDYRPYLPARVHEEFDAFVDLHREHGHSNVDPEFLLRRTDSDVVERWTEDVIDAGRLDGVSDPHRRLRRLDTEGIAAEVLFPDFGLPFELGSPFLNALRKTVRTPEQIDLANRAHNRWLVDFCGAAPERFAGMALVSFDDVEAAVDEIRWAKEAGLKGVILPSFAEDVPLFDPRFEPIWHTLEEVEMPINSHPGPTSTTRALQMPPVPHPAAALPLFTAKAMFYIHQVLDHLIWGGVLERHPKLRAVLTEQGSGWVVGALNGMDFTYESSFLRRDIRELIPQKPSEYFRRQVFLGSSIFSRGEIEARHHIGLSRITLGMDYPHHEGTWGVGPGTKAYLQATLGAAHVPPGEAAAMLGGNAAGLWGFDTEALEPIRRRIGASYSDLLTPPEEDHYPRGDVKKPSFLAF